ATGCPSLMFGQQLKITDFVIFAGNGNCATCTVSIGPTSSVTGGSIGSSRLVQTTGSSNVISSNIYSAGTAVLTTNNKVTGNITAANSASLGGNILSVGTGAQLLGNIDVNGNIVVSGGTVSGRVTHPLGTTYTGPAPGQGNVVGTPNLPFLP